MDILFNKIKIRTPTDRVTKEVLIEFTHVIDKCVQVYLRNKELTGKINPDLESYFAQLKKRAGDGSLLRSTNTELLAELVKLVEIIYKLQKQNRAIVMPSLDSKSEVVPVPISTPISDDSSNDRSYEGLQRRYGHIENWEEIFPEALIELHRINRSTFDGLNIDIYLQSGGSETKKEGNIVDIPEQIQDLLQADVPQYKFLADGNGGGNLSLPKKWKIFYR